VKKIFVGIGILTVVFGIVWAARAWTVMHTNARMAEYNRDVDNLFACLQKYKERAGTYPMGGNLEVAKALQGNNSKNLIIIIGDKIPTNEKGEFVDPWGTPLRIYFSDTGVLIRSAGPNRRFDDTDVLDADDIIRSN
jgi:hypothetical protein